MRPFYNMTILVIILALAAALCFALFVNVALAAQSKMVNGDVGSVDTFPAHFAARKSVAVVKNPGSMSALGIKAKA